MKLTKRDKLLIIVLVFILLAVVFYTYVYTPLRNEIDQLESKNSSLKRSKSEILSKSSQLKQIDAKILNAKIEAIPYENIASGSDNTVIYEYLKENLFINKDATPVRKFYYDGTEKEIFGFNSSSKSLKKITKQNASGKNETYTLYMYTASSKFTANGNGEEGLNDLYTFLQRLTDNFKYIHVSSYTIKPPAQTAGDSEKSRYSITLSMDIYVAEGDWNDYALGTCPWENGDGTLCGAYNEFSATHCHECGNRIDDCPNPNCGKLIKAESGMCPYCGAIVKVCSNCSELVLDSEEYCSSCNQKAD